MLAVDRVRVSPGDAPRRGEVWAFCTADGRVLVHRCRRVGPPVVFQGDGNRSPDHPVPSTHLVGRVTAVETSKGWVELGPADRVRGLTRVALWELRSLVARRAPPWLRDRVRRRA